ncbi:transmembrane protein 234 homolog [Chironomus tepperi]|uniref:transmembrane protein 234 homolog n=1 Tax=Chironomus tepperi TaxID=113505 RepID=UPI00391F9234
MTLHLYVITAILWGITNVLLKKNSKGIKDIKIENSRVKQILAELKYLATNWKYFTTFGVNQLGSILYFYALNQKSSLSVAVILTNSLTMLITSITSIILEKHKISLRILLGGILVTLGSSLICISHES